MEQDKPMKKEGEDKKKLQIFNALAATIDDNKDEDMKWSK